MNKLTKRAFFTASTISGALLAGCTSAPPTAPVNTAPAPATSSTSTPTPSSTPPAPVDAPAESSAPVIDPNGYGRLNLGMTFAEVNQAGFIRHGDPPSQSCNQYELYSGGGRDGFVYITEARGVEVIAPDRRVRTADGVEVGWTTERVKSVYSELDLEQLKDLGRANIETRGNPAANYRLGFGADGRVADISLQFDDQPCYE